MNQVLDELGVGIGQEMASVPATRAPEAASTVSVDADLQVRAYPTTYLHSMSPYITSYHIL